MSPRSLDRHGREYESPIGCLRRPGTADRGAAVPGSEQRGETMTKHIGFIGETVHTGPVKTPGVVSRISVDVRARVEKVKLLVLDVDGVLTDGRLYYHDDGTELKAFDVRDGHGIKLAQRAGIEVALISGRSAPCVNKRAADLGITEVVQGPKEKVPVFDRLLTEKGLTPKQAAFVGDDLVDLPVMRRAGFAVAVADASEHLFDAAHYVTLAPGGRGAVREVIELILAVQGLWERLVGRYFEG
jgi:3-deoxy-D-manno-octulosonate 8-phosphate phosphatase (KDO 8-P phosphatase)